MWIIGHSNFCTDMPPSSAAGRPSGHNARKWCAMASQDNSKKANACQDGCPSLQRTANVSKGSTGSLSRKSPSQSEFWTRLLSSASLLIKSFNRLQILSQKTSCVCEKS